MYKFIVILLIVCGCSNHNSDLDQPKTYKNNPPSQEISKKGTVGEYWQKNRHKK